MLRLLNRIFGPNWKWDLYWWLERRLKWDRELWEEKNTENADLMAKNSILDARQYQLLKDYKREIERRDEQINSMKCLLNVLMDEFIKHSNQALKAGSTQPGPASRPDDDKTTSIPNDKRGNQE